MTFIIVLISFLLVPIATSLLPKNLAGKTTLVEMLLGAVEHLFLWYIPSVI